MQTNVIYTYKELLGNDYVSLDTKKYDMGYPSVRKKIRRFYISFDGNQIVGDIQLEYRVDDCDWIEVNDIEVINNNIYMFDLPRSITSYWIQLRITGNMQHAIQDISIIYRPKLPK